MYTLLLGFETVLASLDATNYVRLGAQVCSRRGITGVAANFFFSAAGCASGWPHGRSSVGSSFSSASSSSSSPRRDKLRQVGRSGLFKAKYY